MARRVPARKKRQPSGDPRGRMARLAAGVFARLPRPTREFGWVAFLTAACLFVYGQASGTPHPRNAVLLAALVLLALLLFSWLVGELSLSGVALKRKAPERGFAGESVPVKVIVENPRPRLPVGAVRVHEEMQLAGRVRQAGLALVCGVAPRDSEPAEYLLPLRRRGVWEFGESVVSSTFPFGLFRHVRRRRVAGRLVVYPRLGVVAEGFFREAERFFRQQLRARPSREDDDFRGLREYRLGDNPKWIHWRTSARWGKPLIKEFEHPETRRVVILLDSCLPRSLHRPEAHLEAAISFAATLARDCLLHGYKVDFAGFVPRLVQMRLERERRNLGALLEVLAALHGTRHRDLGELYLAMDRSVLERAMVVVIVLGSQRRGVNLERFARPEAVTTIVAVDDPVFRELFHGGVKPDLAPELLEDAPAEAKKTPPPAATPASQAPESAAAKPASEPPTWT